MFVVASHSSRVPRPVRFLLTGAANTLVGIVVIFGLKALLGANDFLANALGYLTGMLVSFVGNANWTFSFTGPPGRAFPRFALIVALAYGANLAAFTLAAYAIGVNSYLAQLAGVGPYALLMYFGMKHYVFPAQGTGARVSNEPR